ncbi:MAG: hypothetical protein ACOX4D_01340 [Bacteroidales bacterium]|jgi:hypothetical protein
MKKIIFIAFNLIISIFCFSQENKYIGGWSGHFSYDKLIGVASDNENLIYGASKFGVFSYNKETFEISKKTKINGLSDINISCIEYDNKNKLLLIGYNNANIDILKDNKVINIPDILLSNLMAKKTINSILFLDNYAYLACGFGIVVVDVKLYEIKDTYFLGFENSTLNVNDIVYDFNNDMFYATTDSGLYVAPNASNANLAFSENWNKIEIPNSVSSIYNHIELFHNNIVVSNLNTSDNSNILLNYDGNNWNRVLEDKILYIRNMGVYDNKLILSLYGQIVTYDQYFNMLTLKYMYNEDTYAMPNETIIDNEGKYWCADNYNGLVYVKDSFNGDFHYPQGPTIQNPFNIKTNNNVVFLLGGGYDVSWVPTYSFGEVNFFKKNEWVNLVNDIPELRDILDITDIAVDPRDNTHIYIASYGRGLIEIKDNKILNIFNGTNSQLTPPPSLPLEEVRVGGLAYDKDNNLWITNSLGEKILHVILADGSWGDVKTPSSLSIKEVSEITIDTYGQKWLKARESGTIYVINDNGTPEYSGDDKAKALNYAPGNGNIPGSLINTITCDQFGDVWIGTEQGVAVFYYPENIFSGGNFDAEKIIISNEETANQPLLGNETVKKIFVDYNNNKWIGTASSGVYYVNQYGTEEIYHFDNNNSLLLSNNILDISINDIGDVFFLTDKGLCSYRNYSAKPRESFQNIYAYPNPVRPNHLGPIAINGLKDNSYVKITDMEGKVVFSGTSDGGQIVWDGTDASGNRVSSGVYIVFAVSQDGKDRATTKILFIK